MLERIKFDQQGLVPAIVQDATNGTVLMLAYMNRESLAKTLETGTTWFYSRSRQELWNKGATSGHVQMVKELLYDCDGDTLLVKVEQKGAACRRHLFLLQSSVWRSGTDANRTSSTCRYGGFDRTVCSVGRPATKSTAGVLHQ